MFYSCHNNKKTYEEKNCRPFHLMKMRLRLISRKNEEEGGSCNGDGGAIEMCNAMSEEPKNHKTNDKDGFNEKTPIRNRLSWIEPHNHCPSFWSRMKHRTIYKIEHPKRYNCNNGGNRREIEQELIEGKICRAPDENIGWVPDKSRRTADVREQNSTHEERFGSNFEVTRDHQCDRYHEENGRNVIEKCREKCSHETEEKEDSHWVPLRFFCSPDRCGFVHTATLTKIDNHHHANKKPKGIEIHPCNSSFLMQHSNEHHNHRSGECYNCSMNLLCNNNEVRCSKNCNSNPELSRKSDRSMIHKKCDEENYSVRISLKALRISDCLITPSNFPSLSTTGRQ